MTLLKSFNPFAIACVAATTLLLSACGSSTTVADIPENYSGNYSGTVRNQSGANDLATLTLIQQSTTQTNPEGNNNSTPVTTITLTGFLVISPSTSCQISVQISEGTANANSVILELGTSTSTTEEGDETTTTNSNSGSLALSGGGRTLTGNIAYTGVVPAGCPTPGGAAVFRR